MKYFKQFNSTTSFRAPTDLDVIVEEIALRERRTKTAVVALALEEYAEKHHADIFGKHKEKTNER